jgi:hypothetical protein
MGRRPIGKTAMTRAERVQRHRQGLKTNTRARHVQALERARASYLHALVNVLLYNRDPTVIESERAAIEEQFQRLIAMRDELRDR